MGAEFVTPKCDLLSYELFEAGGSRDPEDSRKTFTLPLTI